MTKTTKGLRIERLKGDVEISPEVKLKIVIQLIDDFMSEKKSKIKLNSISLIQFLHWLKIELKDEQTHKEVNKWIDDYEDAYVLDKKKKGISAKEFKRGFH